MPSIDAARSGVFAIGGDLEVVRLGFGAMRITGKGVWGAPQSHEQAVATLRHTSDLGITLIDTADSYGPFVSEDLIREALFPYGGQVIATKGGLTRHGPDIWRPVGHPDYLRQCVLMSLRRLGVERIDLWQLHRVGADCPPETQFEAIAKLQQEGLIRHVGLSEVDVPMIERAGAFFPVTTVQNRFNLVDRKSEDVLDYCEAHQIGFIPWAPLAAGSLARPGTVLDAIAKDRDASPGQIALAWLLHRSPVILPIPGTGSPAHLEENVRAASITLSEEECAALDKQGREAWKSSEN
ncbi:aldo/keto reductase [Asaia bogorensis]|uniref:Oxidoreductase n=1 Tax=Asaia bogorensis NBRC 16594 TaxID=1231624 RepID=A0AAN4R134_9PROT|nr:aldo/keto reductase [Asaia bogorensis]BAT18458.1 aldo/keto reductase, oxidoreductase [Asaia bogorensis NBRC 16594]GBQ74850.1 aldo/keto reductase [Asaia bogorensis NBRC 16594]GEL52809.1 oxidoreductase [Asaia bogorensis NBRC 16594]